MIEIQDMLVKRTGSAFNQNPVTGRSSVDGMIRHDGLIHPLRLPCIKLIVLTARYSAVLAILLRLTSKYSSLREICSSYNALF